MPDATNNSYQVEVRRSGDEADTESITAQVDEPFQVDDIRLHLTRRHNIQFIARRDFGLPLLVIGLVVVIGAGLLLLLWPPWLVWLIPEVKGRGGQLYGVAEKIGPAQPMTAFLEQLLADKGGTTDKQINEYG